MTKMTKLTTASVLAFERKLDISDAFFWQADSTELEIKSPSERYIKPVKIVEKSVRGTISNRLKNAIANNPEKLDAEIEKPNLQKIDTAALDADNDTLIARWSCKVQPFTGLPSMCNSQPYQQALLATVNEYLQEHGMTELAHRYATNIVNARWLWRNRVGAKKIAIKVVSEEQEFNFGDAKQVPLNQFGSTDKQVAALAKIIEQGLLGEKFVILYIEAKAIIGYGQEVFPSQELVLDKHKEKSKVLYQVNGIAGMHSQKVGNAIRTIDNWYSNAEFAIAVEPYGAVSTMGASFRQPKQKQDFYTLFDNWVLKGEKPEVEQQHYVMAVLIRGGVFGASGKE